MGNAIARTSHSPRTGKKLAKEKPGRVFRKGVDNVALVQTNWLDALNHHEVETIKNFAAPGSVVSFKGAHHGMALSAFIHASDTFFESFPDQKITWESIEEIKPGVVMIKSFQGQGTHTGKPFGFGPFPELPAKGVFCKEDPCHITLTLHKGKIESVSIDCYSGTLCGPPGFYQMIGGNIGPSKPKQ